MKLTPQQPRNQLNSNNQPILYFNLALALAPTLALVWVGHCGLNLAAASIETINCYQEKGLFIKRETDTQSHAIRATACVYHRLGQINFIPDAERASGRVPARRLT